MGKVLKERDIEHYLCRRVKAVGGEVRKVTWLGRDGAPDRVVMLPHRGLILGEGGRFQGYEHDPATIWVEVKNPETIKTFPANAHERKQFREHQRMRALGQCVVVVGTFEQVDEVLA